MYAPPSVTHEIDFLPSSFASSFQSAYTRYASSFSRSAEMPLRSSYVGSRVSASWSYSLATPVD
eukprot:7379838-Prymnesium_polylepis.2